MTLVINTIDKAQEKAVIAFLENEHIPYSQRQTLEEYNQELEDGEAAIDNGEFITNDQIKQQMKEW